MHSIISEKIVVNPEIVGGQPHLVGTRFTVKQIVVWHELMAMSADEIAHAYQIDISSIYAALSYYFDHQVDIQKSIREEAVLVETLKQRFPSKLIRAYA